MIKEHFAFNFCWKYFNTVSFGSQAFNFRFCLCALSTRLVLPGALSIVNHIWQQTRRFRKFCTEARLVGKLLSWHMGIGRTTICDIKVTSKWLQHDTRGKYIYESDIRPIHVHGGRLIYFISWHARRSRCSARHNGVKSFMKKYIKHGNLEISEFLFCQF